MFLKLLIALFISYVSAQSGHPNFDPETEAVILQEGSFEKIECIAKGDKPLSYLWYNQTDKEISSDANQPIFSRITENGSTLIFAQVNSSNAGFYTCKATNEHGSATKIYDVAVNSTSVNGTIDKVTISNVTENSVEFIVQTTGDSEFVYVIYRETREKIEQQIEFKRGEKIVVKNLIPSGSYEFQFQLELPSIVKRNSTAYQVVLLPSVPDVIFRNVKDGSVEIEWFRSMDDFMRKTIDEYYLTYYQVRMSGGNRWESSDCEININISRPCYYPRYTIAGLSKGSYYEMQLKAHTSAGYGKPYKNKIYV